MLSSILEIALVNMSLRESVNELTYWEGLWPVLGVLSGGKTWFSDPKDRFRLLTIPAFLWWLVDDGGLCILVAHLMQKQKAYKDAQIRIFTGLNAKDQIDARQRKMKSLMEKFRIGFESIEIIKDITNHPSDKLKNNWLDKMEKFMSSDVKDTESNFNQSINTNNHPSSSKLGELANDNAAFEDISMSQNPEVSIQQIPTVMSKNTMASEFSSTGVNVGQNVDFKIEQDGAEISGQEASGIPEKYKIDRKLFQRGDTIQEKTKTWRQLQHNSVIKQYSGQGKVNKQQSKRSKQPVAEEEDPSLKADLVIITCPVMKAGNSPYLYMSWLDTLSDGIDCPVLLLRGNQENAITFYMS